MPYPNSSFGVDWSRLKDSSHVPLSIVQTLDSTRLLIASGDTRLVRQVKRFADRQSLQATSISKATKLVDNLVNEQPDLLLMSSDIMEQLAEETLKAVRGHASLLLWLRAQEDKLPSHFSAEDISFCIPVPCHEDSFAIACRQAVNMQSMRAEKDRLNTGFKHLETLLQVTVNSAFDLVYMLDNQGVFLFAGDRLEALLGYPRGTLTGKHYSEMVHEDDAELARHIFGNKKKGAGLYRNVEMRLKSVATGEGASHVIVELNSSGVYTSDTNEFIGVYGVARQIAERKAAEDSSHFSAYHDFLTRLPNRVLFRDRLNVAISQSRRDKKTFAVMFLDLDKFKHVNDTLGHSVGDQVLTLVAERIRASLRRGDTLARFGGDEFIMLLPEASSEEQALTIARKISRQLHEPLIVEGHHVDVGASIGIALYPKSGKDVEEMISHADQAMYQAKLKDTDRHQVFSKLTSRNTALREKTIRDIEADFKRGRFSNLYYPQIDLATGKIIALVAEAAWQHETLGLIKKASFDSAMKQAGLTAKISEKMERNAVSDLLDWQEQSLPALRLCLSVPVTRLMDNGFPAEFLNNLTQKGLEKSLLELEITEDVLTHDLELLTPKLALIGQKGISIALDHFGANWFSILHLQRFSVNTIKIDRTFVRELHREIYSPQGISPIRGIIAMAHALKIRVVAEGVETKQQADYLRSVGCNNAQGPLFGPPRSSAETAELIRKQPWSQGQL